MQEEGSKGGGPRTMATDTGGETMYSSSSDMLEKSSEKKAPSLADLQEKLAKPKYVWLESTQSYLDFDAGQATPMTAQERKYFAKDIPFTPEKFKVARWDDASLKEVTDLYARRVVKDLSVEIQLAAALGVRAAAGVLNEITSLGVHLLYYFSPTRQGIVKNCLLC